MACKPFSPSCQNEAMWKTWANFLGFQAAVDEKQFMLTFWSCASRSLLFRYFSILLEKSYLMLSIDWNLVTSLFPSCYSHPCETASLFFWPVCALWMISLKVYLLKTQGFVLLSLQIWRLNQFMFVKKKSHYAKIRIVFNNFKALHLLKKETKTTTKPTTKQTNKPTPKTTNQTNQTNQPKTP